MKIVSWQSTPESIKRVDEAIKRAGQRVIWVSYFGGPWIRT